MAVATYYYHEKVRRKMRTAILLHLLNPLSAKLRKWPNTLKQFADELFECVLPFCGIGA